MASETPVTDVPSHVLDFLREHDTLTLATASSGGVPHATTLVYVNEGVLVYAWVRPGATTARHIEQNPVVSFTIDEFASDWRKIKGIQARGDCRTLLDSNDIDRVIELFADKYSSLKGALGTDLSFFQITPTELQFIDNTAAEDQPDDRVDFHRDLVYSLFRDLPEREVERVEAQLRTVEIPEGDVIVRQGAPADKFFIIVDGEVEVVQEGEGAERPLATLGRGQFFGEIAILRDMPRMATVRARQPTTLFAMESDVFRSLVAQSMGTTEDFDTVIRQRLDELRQTGAS
jgi:uncharacterized protein YhbP (UPF0306 family)